MSRSFRKSPYTGFTTARSEKKDKQFSNRKVRRKISQIDLESVEDCVQDFDKRDYTDVYSFSKDGKMHINMSEYSVDEYRKLMGK